MWIPVVERRCKNSELSEKTTWWPGTKSSSYYLQATPTNRTEHLYWEIEDNSTVPVEEPSPIETQPEPEAEAETQTKTVKYVKKGVLYGYHHLPTIKIPAIAYIKEDWYFKGKTILVVINEQGIVENYNAIDILRSSGTEAFPFDKEAIKNEKRCIFFHGGRDKEWTQKFEKTIESVEQRLSSDHITKISWYCIGKNDRYGPHPVMSGHGETVLLALEKLDRKLEKGSVKIDYQTTTSFEEIFKDCHNNVIKKYGGRCFQLAIPHASGKRPEERKCSECDNAMEVKLLYECCHRDTDKAARR
ncbi:Sieve element occlusion, C-terminal [Parasponia andersonii]|uniref:Sieve element occlusion, C-terminal n=1 Tax=Parasponia andersonii TaxID=3476 RepID=A0A2P5BWT7_PARAD|nr:Sieve element occlusion, C-terminal [Parasponia andersonii]